MSVLRVMGTETEYAVQSDEGHNPVQWSCDVIGAAADEERAHIRWDYRQEDPVHDMRGLHIERAAARPEMLTDEPQPYITNVIGLNGARLYVDHAHPEYSAPEVRDPFTAVVYDSAGDVLMQQAAQRAHATLFRNNVDGKGASWGSHENYMMRRDVPFHMVRDLLLTHFVTRQLYTGAGRIGIGEHSEEAGYQLSQRADYFHMKEGLQTTFDRPIINTRDESHSEENFRRLHVIVGDANRMDVPRVLKLGTTSLLLWVLEMAQEHNLDIEEALAELQLADPVRAMHTVSHDLSLSQALAMQNGQALTAWQLQIMLRALVYETAAAVYGTDSRGEPLWPDEQTKSVMAMWQQALLDIAAIRHAEDRLTLTQQASRIEWLAKWQIIERMRERVMPEQSFEEATRNARIQMIDLMWANLDEKRSLFAKIRPRTARTTTDTAIAEATHVPPSDTRAWLRGEVVQRFANQIRAISWTHMTTIADSHGTVWTLDMSNPLQYTKEDCAQQLANADSIWVLFAQLGAQQHAV